MDCDNEKKTKTDKPNFASIAINKWKYNLPKNIYMFKGFHTLAL